MPEFGAARLVSLGRSALTMRGARFDPAIQRSVANDSAYHLLDIPRQ
jgi:hypothetical protein